MGETSKKEPKAKTFFRRLFSTKKNLHTTRSAPPPPYTDAQVQPQDQERQIKAADIPQFQGSRNQCKEWITSVLVEYGSLPESEAKKKAERFKGFGPSLFAIPPEGWKHVLGNEMGNDVFALILTRMDQAGALLENVTYNHLVKRERVGANLY